MREHGKQVTFVQFERSSFEEVARFEPPTGFQVEALPDSVRLEASFGSYESRIVREESTGSIVLQRKLTFRSGVISVDEYPLVRSFYERPRAAERGMVILARR